MIAALPTDSGQTPLYLAFLDALSETGFAGDMAPDYANRTVLATDNSIYQRVPQAVLYPRDTEDLCRIAELAARERFRRVVLAPRGGGTGTNGQSLTDGLVVDVSRYMNRIIDIDVDNRRVRVQAGVVKDQLNAALAPHGLFFAPELSTSNRATLGGMISTDASGQGSCRYGKTRNHVLALDMVLLGGLRLCSKPRVGAALEEACERTDRIGAAYRTVRDIATTKGELIDDVFPPLNRCLTGYDLAHLHTEDGALDLNSVLCGSEGTLGFIAEATLNVLPVPKHVTLVNVRYRDFMDALRDARSLMGSQARPTSIETVDSTVLALAMNDIVWNDVAEFFPGGDEQLRGINLIEFSDDDADRLNERVGRFCDHLSNDDRVRRLGYTRAEERAQVTRVYAMRKRAVGLLGNVEGDKRPIPFVEDTAVPPERLADYIAEFRQALDARGLKYGMFGHVDAGVLHVRPAIDMRDPAQAGLVRELSDEVVALTRKYGGLLWGEHGKGIRSEFVPEFFGPLYPELQRIKAAFDPYNQINPGKIATPRVDDSEARGGKADLLRIDEVVTRGQLDRQIAPRVWQGYPSAVHCNGNGACFNYASDDYMCPSWKATRERIHSPKGRAGLMREWLRLQGQAGVDVLEVAGRTDHENMWGYIRNFPSRLKNTVCKWCGEPDFSHQVYDAMAGCLACKSCAGQCPVKVDVPTLRSQFLNLYHGRYLRSPRDWLVGNLEIMLPWLEPFAALYNAVLGLRPAQWLLERTIGLVDAPRLSRRSLRQQFENEDVELATPATLNELDDEQKARSVILVQDAFTSYYETELIEHVIELLKRLGIRTFMAPYGPNGKPLHVHGFIHHFKRIATVQAQRLSQLADCGVALVGIDPAMTLVYRQEYVKMLDKAAVPTVLLPQEWLLSMDRHIAPQKGQCDQNQRFRLLIHCTEATNVPGAAKSWQQVYEYFGLELELVTTGCCGMSGTYGHESRNRETSEHIYNQSWRGVVKEEYDTGHDTETIVMATGYSCRSQVMRLSGEKLMHPLQGLLLALASDTAKR